MRELRLATIIAALSMVAVGIGAAAVADSTVGHLDTFEVDRFGFGVYETRCDDAAIRVHDGVLDVTTSSAGGAFSFARANRYTRRRRRCPRHPSRRRHPVRPGPVRHVRPAVRTGRAPVVGERGYAARVMFIGWERLPPSMAPVGDRDAPVVVYSDYVCPFCYLGKVQVDRARAAFPDAPRFDWRPFDLRGIQRRPDGSLDMGVADGKDEAYYARAEAGVRRLSADWGVPLASTLARDVDSFDAQKLGLWIRDRYGDDAFDTFHDAAFEALWTEGRDIGSADVLVALAGNAGADTTEARAALTDPAQDDALRAAFASAARMGIHAVPTWIVGGEPVPGALPEAQWVRFFGRP